MRITKLHLLLFFLLAGAGIYGAYFWRERQAAQEKEAEAKAQESMRMAQKKAEEEAMMKKSEHPPVPEPQAPASVPVKINEPSAVTYKVKKGDTLWKIAKMPEHFGQGHRWYDIWKANEGKIFDFDHLVRGQELTIPLDKPEGFAWPKTDEERRKKVLSRPGRRKEPVTN